MAPLFGFRLFGLALPLSLVAMACALVALVRTRREQSSAAWRRSQRAAVGGALCFAVMFGLALPSLGRPLINDVTTDPSAPVRFYPGGEAASACPDRLSYPAEFGPVQQAAYPHLAPLYLKERPAEVFERARRALASLPNARLTLVDEDRMHVEAVVESRIFHFADDVAVEVRPYGRGSRVDVRSRSRVGRGDLGANALRVETLLALLD